MHAPPLGEFGHSVGFLLSQLGYAVTRRFRAGLEEFSLEPRHFGLLRAIDANARSSQQGLADALHIPASSIVTLLDGLESRGLVTRRPDSNDRRVRVVELTPQGRSVLARAVKVAIETEMELCGWMSPDERELMITRLQDIANHFGLTLGVHPASEDQPGH
jgi:DNA-binding MarR family transcriptional regulator